VAPLNPNLNPILNPNLNPILNPNLNLNLNPILNPILNRNSTLKQKVKVPALWERGRGRTPKAIYHVNEEEEDACALPCVNTTPKANYPPPLNHPHVELSSAELRDGARDCSDGQWTPNYAKPETKQVLLLDDEVSPTMV
jgi:hypothetical protein